MKSSEANIKPTCEDAPVPQVVPNIEASAVQTSGLGKDLIPPQLYPLADLYESPLNPRKIIPETSLAALAESMRQQGFRQWQPIIARPRTEGGGAEVAAGHRRRIAAIRAGLTHVPAVIVGMTDKEFSEILNFDNSGREDVHALHEAAGWRDHMARTGDTYRDIMARTGLSRSAVFQRLKYADLIEDAQRLFLEGGFKEAHAYEIARLTHRDQFRALEWLKPIWDCDREVSVRALRSWIRENCHLSLDDACFSPGDETLPILTGGLADSMGGLLGSCLECPKLSGNNPELYADIAGPNVCTDPACYKGKATAHKAREPKPAPPAPPPAAAPVPPPAPKLKRTAPAPPVEDEPKDDWREKADAEQKRQQREAEIREKVYLKTVDAIAERVTWPLEPKDLQPILAFMCGSFDCSSELVEKFAIPRKTSSAYQDLMAEVPNLKPARVAKLMVMGVLLDTGYQEGFTEVRALHDFAKRYKVDLKKVATSVLLEIDGREELRQQNPPAAPVPAAADARKASIGKLPTLDAPKKPKAKAAPKAAAKAKPAKAKAKGKK